MHGSMEVRFMEKDKITNLNDIKNRMPTMRSIKESMNNHNWLSPFTIEKNHFKSLMTKVSINSTTKDIIYH